MLHRTSNFISWTLAGLLVVACSPPSPETQNIIIAPAPGEAAPLGTDVPTVAATTLFVSRGSLTVTVQADSETYTLRGSLLQGAIRTTDLVGFSDARGEFDLISEAWRCDGCEALIPVARETLFPTGRNPYLHVVLVPDDTGMTRVEWSDVERSRSERFSSDVSGTPRDLTAHLIPVDSSTLFSNADKRALARGLGVRRVDHVGVDIELHLTNDPVRAGASASVRITTPVDDGDDRPLWEEAPSSTRGNRGSIRASGAEYETRSILEGASPTPEFVNESGR